MTFGSILVTIYLGLLFFEPQQFFPALQGVRVTYIFGIFTLLWVMIFSPMDVRSNLLRNSLFRLVISFSILCALSQFLNKSLAPESARYIDLMTMLKALALFLMVSLTTRTSTDFIRLCWVLIIFATINSVVTIYFHHIGALPWRLVSYFGTPGTSGSNELALLMVEMLPFPLLLLKEKAGKSGKVFLLISLMSFLYCLTRTRSRAGFVGLAICFLVLVFYRYFSIKQLVFALIIVALIFVKSPTSYFSRVSTTFDEETYEEDSNVTSRIENLKRGALIMSDYPLFGIGLGSSHWYIRGIVEEGRRGFVIHNAYVHVGADSGLLAMIIFCLIVINTFRSLQKLGSTKINKLNAGTYIEIQPYLRAAAISVLGYAWMAMTLSIRFDRVFFVLIALAISSNNLFGVRSSMEMERVFLEKTKGKMKK